MMHVTKKVYNDTRFFKVHFSDHPSYMSLGLREQFKLFYKWIRVVFSLLIPPANKNYRRIKDSRFKVSQFLMLK